jgi:hypothetical protein
MPNKVTLTPHFESRYKRFAKKFTSLESEMDSLIDSLIEKPMLGEPLGAGLYKIRLAVKSKGKGKSGGFRVVSYLITETTDSIEIFLLTIYDKSEEGSIRKETLIALAKAISEE